MAEWRVGRSVGRTLYLDGKLIGLVDTPEIASEIVETMNRQPYEEPLLPETAYGVTEIVATEALESGRERSPQKWRAAADRALAEARSRECSCPEPRPLTDWTDHSEAEATPKKDLRIDRSLINQDPLGASRVDPYDTKKGFGPDPQEKT